MRESILSVDASLSSCGWSVIDFNTKEVINVDRICTTSKISEDDRIFNISKELVKISNYYNINTIILEGQYVGKNAKTTMQLARLRGGLMMSMRIFKKNVEYIMPGEIKVALMGKGFGQSSKEEVASFVLDYYANNKVVQAIGPYSDKTNKKKTSDKYDAISIGLGFLIKKDNEQKVLAS